MVNRRVGIFGGTFDPPHLGHLMVAEGIREDLELDEVRFVPCRRPPHKDRPDLTEAMHRYAMVVAAILQNPTFAASALEVERPGKSYSIDTVRLLQADVGSNADMFFVSGLDSFLEVKTWKEPEELLRLSHFVIVSRPGSHFDELRARLPEPFQARLVDLRRHQESVKSPASVESAASVQAEVGEETERPAAGNVGSRGETTTTEVEPGNRVFLSDVAYLDISSTEIRERVRDGRSIRYRVPREVGRYIDAHGLYRQQTDATAS